MKKEGVIFCILISFLIFLDLASCFTYPCPKDKSTYTNCEEYITTHLFLNLTVDFNDQTLTGFADVVMNKTSFASSQHVILDTRHLKIFSVFLSIGSEMLPLKFNLTSYEGRNPVFGSALTITLPSEPVQSPFTLRIHYQANNNSETIQFLRPEQTAGKKYPYLFTQSESIFARTMFPCQDTPSIKATYTALISVPDPLVVVMSASKHSGMKKGRIIQKIHGNLGNTGSLVYQFEQKIPIPAYLIALAAGALENAQIGPRSRVWCEKEMIDAAKYEFAETESFIQAAESFLIPYEWGVYDLLLLPPSFPFGGMENPQLTFVTPTLLAGDRSLANVIAHEIAHSWSGNLVTNQNWEDFWLNEGFTVYTERRIVALTRGEEEAELHALIGLNSLKKDLEFFNQTGHMELSRLVPTLDNVNPDDAFSTVPYEKGFNFLYYLDKLVGRENFLAFLRSYFTSFAYQTVNHQQMKQFFLDFMQTKVDPDLLSGIEWDKWLYTEGMPYKQNKFDTTLADQATDLAEIWIKNPSEGSKHDEFLSWSSNQKAYFLDYLIQNQNRINQSSLDLLDIAYSMRNVKNSEIEFRWQSLCLTKDYEKIYPAVVQFITSQGRLKFVRPLYLSLFNAKDGRQLAIDTFVKNRNFYHPVAANTIAHDLGIE